MQLAVQTGSSQQRRVTQSEWAKFGTEVFRGERGHVAVMTVNTTKVSFSQISGTTGCNSGKCVGILLIVLHIFDHIWFIKVQDRLEHWTLELRSMRFVLCRSWSVWDTEGWTESHKDLKLTYYDYSARQFMWIVRISAKTDIKKTF